VSDFLRFNRISKSYLLHAERLSLCRVCNIAVQLCDLLRNVYVDACEIYVVNADQVPFTFSECRYLMLHGLYNKWKQSVAYYLIHRSTKGEMLVNFLMPATMQDWKLLPLCVTTV